MILKFVNHNHHHHHHHLRASQNWSIIHQARSKDRPASKIRGQDEQRSTHPTPQSNLLVRTPRSQPPNLTHTFHALIPTVTYKQFACHMPIPISRRSPIIGGSERENRERAHSLPILHGLNEPMVRALLNSPQTCMRILLLQGRKLS